MRYLVIGEAKRTPPMPPDQYLELVIASHEALAAHEKAGKIVAGGIFTGRQGGIAVVEAESHQEVDRLLCSLPFWVFVDWEVIPLVSFESGLERAKDKLAQLRAQKK